MHLTEELESCHVRGLVSFKLIIGVDTDFDEDEDYAMIHLSLFGTKLGIEAITIHHFEIFSTQLN